ncbi:hypothetical protein TNCV_1356231 [Trichonephila clavipes]|uniref:RNase H type-1 domain-containing protein n=1 Tax=Trichonephila clavipes TaxID=2585209 RepID=A0A8X6SGW3_TRICX|nr:hypothetical protein TNCV_1356231 [Trichonephila clavipes]
MDNGHNVTLQWIPCHCRIMGNEFADTPIKGGSDFPKSHLSAKRIIHARTKADFEEKSWNTLQGGLIEVPQ